MRAPLIGRANPKLTRRGWAPFPGWTVLFDRTTLRDSAAWFDLCATAASSPDVVRGAMRLLPPSSYHITVCDGVSPTVLEQAMIDRRGRRRLANPRQLPSRLASTIAALCTTCADQRTFAAVGAERRGSAVVVRALSGDLGAITSARAAVLGELGAELRLDVLTPWRPHVTIGYLTDPTAPAVDTFVATMDALVRSAPGLAVDVEGASVYGFADMASFTRIAPLT